MFNSIFKDVYLGFTVAVGCPGVMRVADQLCSTLTMYKVEMSDQGGGDWGE